MVMDPGSRQEPIWETPAKEGAMARIYASTGDVDHAIPEFSSGFLGVPKCGCRSTPAMLRRSDLGSITNDPRFQQLIGGKGRLEPSFG